MDAKPRATDPPLSELRLRRRALEDRIEELCSKEMRIRELRNGRLVDLTAETLVALYKELGEVGQSIQKAHLALAGGRGATLNGNNASSAR